ncbi:M48 family metalloprotease [Kangiella shandongensis]|uniref:hypothetical protein n=1 Tax=Kangiella shandongensis TaxID=2763258 RepID=UPI001CBA7F26|nr:hypothetical protein [Kangiella shandongensis]
MKTFLVSLVTPLLFTHFAAKAAVPIREIPNPNLSDVAVASIDAQGPVIYYNPRITQQAGPYLSEFFRAHEYGHHHLGHLYREQFQANPYNRAWVRQSYEKEADCYAARRVSPTAARAAVSFFNQLHGASRPDWYHPTGYERAAVIIRCRQG